MTEEIATRATSEEDLEDIGTEDDLLQYLNEEEVNKVSKPDPEDNVIPPAKKEDAPPPPKDILDDQGNIIVDTETTPDNTSTTGEGDTEYNNMVEYINDRYDLKLNIDQIPKDLSREKEAEVIGDLYDKVVQSANTKLSEYQRIDNLLKDKEVASFLEAKRGGKTMKDFIVEYAGTVAGKTDDEMVKDSLKVQFPNMSDDDINDTIEGLRERNKLDVMASQAREKAIKDEEAERIAREASNKLQSEKDEKDRLEEIANYKGYVEKIDKVYGIPVDDSMRQQLVVAATQTDEEGYTYLDKALQSDQGILLATMGLLHMERLIKAGSTTSKNQVRNNLMDKLTSNAEELQSTTRVQDEDGFNVEAANSF